MNHFVLLACGLGAVLAHASPASPQQPAPTFRSGTHLVEVTVIVRDRTGAFVPDLTIDDFVVSENGEPQTVQTLYLTTAPRAAVRARDGALPPARERVRTTDRTFLFLFDMAHLSPGSLTKARAAVSTFAAERLQPSDLSGMVAVGGAVQGKISNDHRLVGADLERLAPRNDALARERPLKVWPRLMSAFEATQIANDVTRAVEEAVERNCLERDLNCTPMSSDSQGLSAVRGEGSRSIVEAEIRMKAREYVSDIRAAARASIRALEQTARLLAALPGRKTVVWLTEGTGSDEAAEEARLAVARAGESGVVIYAVDPRGLGARSGDIHDVEISELGSEALRGMAEDVPNALAAGTGGMFIRHENRLDRALRTIEDDTSTYYVLGYAARPSANRDEFRRIRVSIKRKGLNVRARHGYVAPREATSVAATPRSDAPAAGIPDPSAPIPALPRGLSILPALELPSVLPGTAVSTGVTTAHAGRPPDGVLRIRPDATARARELAEADATSGGEAGEHATRGWTAYQHGDVEAAMGPLQEAAASPDARPWVVYVLGLAQGALGHQADAIASWERVREAAPGFAPVYMDLAATYAQIWDLAGAMAVLRAAGQRWPEDPEVHNGVGVIHLRRGAVDSAIDAFAEAVKVAPDEPFGYLNLARAFELRYVRGGRYISSQRRWVRPEPDRRRAIEYYREYIRRGGPYLDDAHNALLRLQWKAPEGA